MWRSTKFPVIQAYLIHYHFISSCAAFICVQNSKIMLFTYTLYMKCTAFTVFKKTYSVLSVFKCIIHNQNITKHIGRI